MTGDGLSPTARALLDAARDGLAPDPAAVRRVRGKVASSVAAGSIALKLGIFALVATFAAGGAVIANRQGAIDAPRIEMPTVQGEPVAAAVRPARSPAPIIEMAPERIVRARVDHAPRPEARTADLAREVELIDLAMAALRRGDTAAALVSIRTHAAETRGAGQLAEDAAAIEIEALCRNHDPAVVAKLDAFDAQFPRSAQRSRLSVTCP
ncbi:MAG: hypothetical protein JWP01_2259 [Myxococcales bacterium]|nr:hypothetical protein [Myxococcales bacterium]